MRSRDRAALVLVAIALAFSVLAVGGAPRWAACLGAALGVASTIPYVTSRRTASKPSPLLLPLAVAAGLTALQLLPLPQGVASEIAPGKLALVADNAAALGDDHPTWVMASYDPPATLVELAKLLGYLGLAYTCVRLASIRRARRHLATIVAAVATAAAVNTLAHHAAGATALYGLITPEAKPHILGPLFGVNHLASLLSIATPLTLALALTASTGLPRIGWLAAATTLSATTLLTGSRGGLIGLVAGLAVALTLLLIQRRTGTDDDGRRAPLAVSVSAAVIAGCAVILLAVLTAGDVANDLSRTTLAEIHEPHSKFQVWDRSTALVSDNRWLGVGKGGFEPAFTRVSEVGDLTYTHAENSYLQAVVDWGLPGAALLALALATAVRAGSSRWRHSPLDAAAIGGLASLLVHDVADFSLEMPAVAMTAVVTASIIMPARLGTTADADKSIRDVSRKTLALRAGALAAAFVTVVLAATPLGRTLRADANRVGAEPNPRSRLALARSAWSRHPSDYILAGRVAEAMFATGDPRAGKVILRALRMNPLHTGLHLLHARMLVRSESPHRAPPEFAAAVRWAVNVRPLVDEIVGAFRDPAQIARALPPEPAQLTRVIDALGANQRAAYEYARRVVTGFPGDAHAQYALAYTALRVNEIETSLSAAREAERLAPDVLHATVLGRAMAAAGDLLGAIAVLRDADEHKTMSSPERVGLLFTLAEIQVAAGQLDDAKRTLEGVRPLAQGKVSVLVEVHNRMAVIEDGQGNRNQAEWERREAARLRDTVDAN